jgi:hypothetical protein
MEMWSESSYSQIPWDPIHILRRYIPEQLIFGMHDPWSVNPLSRSFRVHEMAVGDIELCSSIGLVGRIWEERGGQSPKVWVVDR